MQIRRNRDCDEFGGEEYHVGDHYKYYVVRWFAGGRPYCNRVHFQLWSPNAYGPGGQRGSYVNSHRELRPASTPGKDAVRAVVRHLEARARMGVNEPMGRAWEDLLD